MDYQLDQYMDYLSDDAARRDDPDAYYAPDMPPAMAELMESDWHLL